MAEVTQVIQTLLATLTFVVLLINLSKSNQIQHATNHMKDELVSEVRAASLAKGRLDQKAEDATSKTN